MIAALLAAAILSATPPSGEASGLTAGMLRDGCALSPEEENGSSARLAMAAAYCDLTVAATFAAVEVDSIAPQSPPANGPGFCLPAGIVQAGDQAPVVRAFIDYVDAHPDVRDDDPDEIFNRAIAGKWPCPR